MAKAPQSLAFANQMSAWAVNSTPKQYTGSMPIEYTEFEGVKFHRNVEVGKPYWMPPRGSGLPYLHRLIYERHHGPIPAGWHVHHLDEDPTNNDPSNLVALTPSEHRKVHPGFDNQSPEQLAHLDSIRGASHQSARENGHYSKMGKKLWGAMTAEERSAHAAKLATARTPEGLKRQSAAMKLYWKNKTPREFTCCTCGSVFTSKATNAKRCIECRGQ